MEIDMIELKEAIKKAYEYIDLMYEGEKLPNKLLEEIEYDEGADAWKVVIGFDSDHVTTKTSGTSLFPSTIREKERKYKQVRIKGETGEFIKMVDQML